MLPLEILLGFLSHIERNHVLSVEVVVARGSHGLEPGGASLERSLEVLVGEDDVYP